MSAENLVGRIVVVRIAGPGDSVKAITVVFTATSLCAVFMVAGYRGRRGTGTRRGAK